MLKKKLLSATTNAYSLLVKEIAIMKKMNHKNIVMLKEVIAKGEEKLYLIMEFC